MLPTYKIYKYPILKKRGLHRLLLPANCKPLSVGQQNGLLYLWALVNVDPIVPQQTRNIYVAFTGETLENYVAEKGTFIGTVQNIDGLVWHIFDLGV